MLLFQHSDYAIAKVHPYINQSCDSVSGEPCSTLWSSGFEFYENLLQTYLAKLLRDPQYKAIVHPAHETYLGDQHGFKQKKKKGKDQESIQSSTTPDPGCLLMPPLFAQTELLVEEERAGYFNFVLSVVWLSVFYVPWACVKVFRIIPEFRILRLTFNRKSASKSQNREILIGFPIHI